MVQWRGHSSEHYSPTMLHFNPAFLSDWHIAHRAYWLPLSLSFYNNSLLIIICCTLSSLTCVCVLLLEAVGECPSGWLIHLQPLAAFHPHPDERVLITSAAASHQIAAHLWTKRQDKTTCSMLSDVHPNGQTRAKTDAALSPSTDSLWWAYTHTHTDHDVLRARQWVLLCTEEWPVSVSSSSRRRSRKSRSRSLIHPVSFVAAG